MTTAEITALRKELEGALLKAFTDFQRLTGVGIRAIRDVLEYHDLQRRSISRSQYEAVIRKSQMAIRNSAVLA